MDQQHFSLHLRRLAGGIEGVDLPEIVRADYVLGRLGFIKAVMFGQTVLLTVVWCALLPFSLRWFDISPGNWIWILGGIHAGVGLLLPRHVPYWVPSTPLRQGFIALSQLELNDRKAFIANLRTDLSRVSYAMLTDLCMQLAMDTRRRPATGD